MRHAERWALIINKIYSIDCIILQVIFVVCCPTEWAACWCRQQEVCVTMLRKFWITTYSHWQFIFDFVRKKQFDIAGFSMQRPAFKLRWFPLWFVCDEVTVDQAYSECVFFHLQIIIPLLHYIHLSPPCEMLIALMKQHVITFSFFKSGDSCLT